MQIYKEKYKHEHNTKKCFHNFPPSEIDKT
jgi:hypothetical protein